MVLDFGFQVSGVYGFRGLTGLYRLYMDSGFGFRVHAVLGIGFLFPGFGFRVSGRGFIEFIGFPI